MESETEGPTAAEAGTTKRLLAEVCACAERLADLLEVENRALREREFGGAAGLITEKTQLINALTAARAEFDRLTAATGSRAALDGDAVEAMVAAADRLRELSAENHTLLFHALTLQGKVIEVITGAVPRALAADAPSYGATGSPDLPRKADAFAFIAKA